VAKADKAALHAFMRELIQEVMKEKPGLWANIRAQRARGEKPSHPNSKAYKDAVKAGKKILKKENTNPEDVVRLNVPLFIRLLEFAREDAQADEDLHFLADNAIRLSTEGETLTMDHYNDLIKQDETNSAD
jgi:hypothetical protein